MHLFSITAQQITTSCWSSSVLHGCRIKASISSLTTSRDHSQLLEVSHILCHVANSIFRASNRQFLSHQIPLTL